MISFLKHVAVILLTDFYTLMKCRPILEGLGEIELPRSRFCLTYKDDRVVGIFVTCLSYDRESQALERQPIGSVEVQE